MILSIDTSTLLGLTFNLAAWNVSEESLLRISEYFFFANEDISVGDRLSVGDHTILFPTSHELRAICMDGTNISENLPSTDGEPLAKRQCVYSPGLVLQVTTFYGLRSLAGCIGQRMRL